MGLRSVEDASQQGDDTVASASRQQSNSDTSRFLRAWAWKREHRVRFHRPYIHPMACPAISLTLKQSKFDAEGFASTIWDSSIVMAKYFERWGSRWAGKKCLDLSAGCGLTGIVLARLGADVVLTDLQPNLPLLAENCKANVPAGEAGSATVMEHRWGERVGDLGGPFDVIVACDVMYIEAAIPDLIETLVAAATRSTVILVSHGRNRQAEGAFLHCCKGKFDLAQIDSSQLDEVYQTGDVDVLLLQSVQTQTSGKHVLKVPAD